MSYVCIAIKTGFLLDFLDHLREQIAMRGHFSLHVLILNSDFLFSKHHKSKSFCRSFKTIIRAKFDVVKKTDRRVFFHTWRQTSSLSTDGILHQVQRRRIDFFNKTNALIEDANTLRSTIRACPTSADSFLVLLSCLRKSFNLIWSSTVEAAKDA